MLFVNPDAHSNRDLPNLALAYAATFFNSRVIDYNTMPEPKERLYSMETDILGISFQSRSFSEAEKIKKKYHKKFPETKIKSLSGFLDVQCCYPFLQWDDTILFEEPFSDKYPFPDYSRFDSFPVFYRNWENGTWPYPILTSLGCPFSCTYCLSRNRKWLPRSPDNCYNELKQAKEKWNIKTFSIADDCFNLEKDRVLAFCEKIKPLKLEWLCTNGLRADRIEKDQAKSMAESGCSTVGFGIESSEPTVLECIRKGETIEQIEEAVHIAKKYFKSISGYFVIGLPGSTYSTDMRTLQWAVKKGIYCHFNYYIPFDKAMQYDAIFYGTGAEPAADTYPKELQQKIYNFTRGLSWGGVNRSITAVAGNRVRILFAFGILTFLKYLSLDAKKIFNKILRTLS